MEVLVERCAGLDVHKTTVMACVRAPAGESRTSRGRWKSHGGELATDPPVAQSRILTGQPDNEGGGAGRDRGATGPAMRVGPGSMDEVSVQASSVAGWTKDRPRRTRERSCDSPASSARSAGRNAGRST